MALGYTCSRCLILGRAGPPKDGGGTTIAAPGVGADFAPDNSHTSNTTKRDSGVPQIAAGRRHRPGRPPLTAEQRRQGARDRQRRARSAARPVGAPA